MKGDSVVNGGEGGIRTHGPCGSPVFKTGSLNHSDISPHETIAQMQELSYHNHTLFVNPKIEIPGSFTYLVPIEADYRILAGDGRKDTT